MTDVDSILSRIRLWAGARHGRKAMLVRETGLRAATLSGMPDPAWNPTADTLRKLDAAVTKLSAEEPIPPHEQA